MRAKPKKTIRLVPPGNPVAAAKSAPGSVQGGNPGDRRHEAPGRPQSVLIAAQGAAQDARVREERNGRRRFKQLVLDNGGDPAIARFFGPMAGHLQAMETGMYRRLRRKGFTNAKGEVRALAEKHLSVCRALLDVTKFAVDPERGAKLERGTPQITFNLRPIKGVDLKQDGGK